MSNLIARRQAVASYPSPASIREVYDVQPKAVGVCWLALQAGTCPFGHEWQTVSSADDTVELPLITYGGVEHLDLSLNAYRAYRASQAQEPKAMSGDEAAEAGFVPGVDFVSCDICDKAEFFTEGAPDWNGETGCHRACEERAREDDFVEVAILDDLCDLDEEDW